MENRTFINEKLDNDIFRSEICHVLKSLGDDKFVITLLKEDWVSQLWKQKKYFEALYIVAMLDYLTSLRNIELFDEYEFYRKQKFEDLIYPKDIMFIEKLLPNEKILQKEIKLCSEDECGKFFMRHNILEKSIRDVV